MPICDHFIYTTGLIGNKAGYQVVAQSSGIPQKLIDDMEGYFFPSGVDPVHLTECRSMLVLTDFVVFSRIKNIGIGFDGRNNTLYNHSIVIKQDEFSKIKYDSRILLDQYFENPSIRGTLEKIFVKEKSLPPASNDINKWPRNMLETIFDAIFSDKKIAVLDIMDIDFIQNLLSLLPASLRKVSFSSLVLDPQRQSHYDFIQLSSESVKSENYQLIDISKLEPLYTNDTDPIFERAIKFYVELIKNQKLDSLNDVNTAFDEIQNSTSEYKLKLLTYFNKINEIPDESLKHKLALDIFDMLTNFDLDIVVKYLPKIEKYVPAGVYEKSSLVLEIFHLVQSARNNPIDFHNITSLFYQLSTENSETRNMLLNTIVKTRFDDLIKSGTQLLLDFRHSGLYRDDILKVFIDNVKLHDCVVSVFTKRNDISKFDIQSFFERILEKSIDLNQFLTLKLLKLPVFDFNERWETENYRKIIENVFKNKKFNQLDYVNNLIELSEILHNRILDITEFKPKSYTAKSDIKQFIKILDLFLKYFTAILEEVTCTPNQVTKIKECISKLDEYMKNYKSYSESEPRHWYQRS